MRSCILGPAGIAQGWNMKSDRQSKRKVEDPLSWCLATDISDEVPNRTTGPFTRDRGVAARPASLDACWSSCALRVMCTFKNPRQIDQRNSDSVIHPTRLIKQGEGDLSRERSIPRPLCGPDRVVQDYCHTSRRPHTDNGLPTSGGSNWPRRRRIQLS